MARTWSLHVAMRFAFVGLTCMLTSAGCMGPWSPRRDTEPLAVSHTSADNLSALPLEKEQPPTVAQQVATAKPVTPVTILTTEQEIALNNLVAEVRATSSLGPAAEHQLRTELRAAREDEWPAVVQHFRSTLAYKQQLLARETRQEAVSHTADIAPYSPWMPPAPTAASEVDRALDKLQAAVVSDSSVQLANHSQPVSRPSLPHSLPVRGTTAANTAADSTTVAEQISGIAPESVDSSAELASAIAALEQEVKTNPGNTAELQEHLRLRMLMLMSGRENDALAPIPGASPTEQDYWSKQLFALATYLDAARVPDTKQRAAGTLIHFDAARAKLAELATLQVRNLTFVDSVDGYGIYQPRMDAKFKPAEQVKLYAEVDNYSSESTKEGYRTRLATSYEVVDLEGRRVDGAQFPDEEDTCRNRRRDFHMVYGMALPTRIYPGQYELRLIITDQMSHKIGQATLHFEIVD